MSSSTGPRTRWSAPPAAPAAGCSIHPPGAGRRTAGWRERPSSPFPGWVCGSPRRPGPDLALFSAAACSGGRLEVLDGIFSTGRAGRGGYAALFSTAFSAAFSAAFSGSRGCLSTCFRTVSEPAFGAAFRPAGGPGLPRRGGGSAGVASGPRGGLEGRPEIRPGGRIFAHFDPAFSGPGGAWEAPGGVIFRGAAENGPVQKKCEGVSSYGLWGLHVWICAMNVRSERMSVSARFSDTAQLGRLCKKSVRTSGRGVQGGSLSKKLSLN